MAIRILDAAVVGRIAAGEVVERPSSVVKELVENSLDAGATSITVEMRGGGIDYLRITDNGCGIEPEQVRIAFENHATSKLQRAEQLDDIRTLGFRGEALPSIAAVSKVEMTTHARGQESGIRYTMEGGKNPVFREAGCPQGTTIVIRDLFFNVPVRRAFLKKPSYEGGLVADTVSRMMLGNPGVSMRFISGGSTLYHSFGDGNLRHAVFAVYGRETAEQMVEVDAMEGGVRIRGLIGTGELSKSTRAHQMFFINGRSVRCPLLTKALETVCRTRVTIGMYPMCVLNLTLPPTAVDVNVHPNKLEVRFRDEETMRWTCEKLLAHAFAGERVLDPEKLAAQPVQAERRTDIREIALPEQKQPTPPEEKPAAAKITEPAGAEPKTAASETRPASAQVLREDPLSGANVRPLKVIEVPLSPSIPAAKPERTAPAPQVTPAPKPSKPEQLQISVVEEKKEKPSLRVIGVAFKTYILVEAGEQLLMIDQHAAHERLNFERLTARAEEGTASQQLLAPVVLQLTAREAAILSENTEVLEEAGYSVEPFGDRAIRVTAVPFVLGKAELQPIFMEMIESLTKLKSATVDARRSEIMQMACKGAVKAGDALPQSEIESLIAQMLKTGAPPTCPHGRPVVKALSKRDLEKMFKRIQ